MRVFCRTYILTTERLKRMAKYSKKKSYGCILGNGKCIAMGNRELTALMVPKLCPLGLLVKVG
jgi:hypothetical protein